MKNDLLFYDAYEDFYDMARYSKCFEKYCEIAFGADFSQDGFSDIKQINMIFDHINETDDLHILDIGCGNGKMLNYLQNKVGGNIYGFDYSQNAIETARTINKVNSDFRVGVMDEIHYPDKSFDLITSMDTMYFTEDMCSFVGQIKRWLKENGTFFIGYQEGDVMPKTDNSDTSVLAQALKKNGFTYDVINITKQTYDMLSRKSDAIIELKDDFKKENLQGWYDVILEQTVGVNLTFDEYKMKNARYIYIAKL